jgi:hypothetical protein
LFIANYLVRAPGKATKRSEDQERIEQEDQKIRRREREEIGVVEGVRRTREF